MQNLQENVINSVQISKVKYQRKLRAKLQQLTVNYYGNIFRRHELIGLSVILPSSRLFAPIFRTGKTRFSFEGHRIPLQLQWHY